MPKLKGFTLAEVLITLTIIGIIAAMTVPTLVSKYQKHTYVVGLKKAYSQLQAAVKMIPITEGCPAGDFECAGLFSATVLNEKSIFMIIQMNLNLIASQFKDGKIISFLSPECQNVNISSTYTACIRTTDGMIIGLSPSNISIDVNGLKGPNTWGRDKFQFIFVKTAKNGIPQGAIIPYGSKLHSTYTGKDTTYWKNWNINSSCTTQNINKGRTTKSCTGRVLEEDAMNY